MSGPAQRAMTDLPAKGRTGRPPKCPYDLEKAGAKWWRWAWRTPQATKWDAGQLYTVARRAQLEDLVEALGFDDALDLRDLLAGADEDAMHRVEWALTSLKKAAGGRLAFEKEMRELDGRLGLTPRAMFDMGWTVGAPAESKDGLDDLNARRQRRRAVGAAI